MRAILGPTNTGKTHIAIERMLGYKSGILGLPLRLLAREVYDRVVNIKGPESVALVTGEEKITPETASYFICTTEAIPTKKNVDFVAIDEIQLIADPERGHIFTACLLDIRGKYETIFLGSETAKPIIKKLLPSTSFDSRPRLSSLSYSGQQKISRIGTRSAIVTFSTEDVYSTAELVRRHRGGAAVVLGALSPRTRNAQIGMFESGEVDYLVATDAIGMGLNLQVNHVSFASLSKFDGFIRRPLTPQEIAQIAGRAGRHLSNGTFGTTLNCPEMVKEIVERVENHNFDNISSAYWRNTQLDFKSPKSLLHSLDAPPKEGTERYLVKPTNAIDKDAFSYLSDSLKINHMDQVKLLWKVCKIPDYRKSLPENHHRLLSKIYKFLSSGDSRISTDWLADHITRLDRMDGDIDTLASRISHIRTWTYVCHQINWVKDPIYWQSRAREVEDKLSDALHDRLTQRFVDKRSTLLTKKLGENINLMTTVDKDGNVSVGGHKIGILSGLTFIAENTDRYATKKLLIKTAQRVLKQEISHRVKQLIADKDSSFKLSKRNEIIWRKGVVAYLTKGSLITKPHSSLASLDIIKYEDRKKIEKKINTWIEKYLEDILSPLIKLQKANLSGITKGLVFEISEGLGTVLRSLVQEQLTYLTPFDKKILFNLGVRIGPYTIHTPAMHKPKRRRICSILWLLFNRNNILPQLPQNVSSIPIDEKMGDNFYLATGHIVLGKRVLRIEQAELLAKNLHSLARKRRVKPTKELYSLAGCTGKEFNLVAKSLGFIWEKGPESGFIYNYNKFNNSHLEFTSGRKLNNSPFSKLAHHPLIINTK